MYDGIKLVAKIEDHQKYIEAVSSNRSIEFTGHINGTTGEIEQPVSKPEILAFTPKQTSSYKNPSSKTNLKVVGDTAIFTGSIQKFFKGNNYSGFTRSELVRAGESVSSYLITPQTELVVRNFEASVTVEHAPIFHSIHAFKARYIFDEMKRNNVPFGKHVYMGNAEKGDYGIKFYDKAKQIELEEKKKLDKQLQQFELVVRNPRWFNNRHKDNQIHCLSDLYDRNVMLLLREEMMKSYYEISANESFLNFKRLSRTLTTTELAWVAGLSNPDIAPLLKQSATENTYKKYAKVYRQVRKDTRNYHGFEEIDEFGYKLHDTILQSING